MLDALNFPPNEKLVFDVDGEYIGVWAVSMHQCYLIERQRRVEVASALLDHEGLLITFNGHNHDFGELGRLVNNSELAERRRIRNHVDMAFVVSDYFFPPNPGGCSIRALSLEKSYRIFFGLDHEGLRQSVGTALADTKTWRDCRMTADLYNLFSTHLCHQKHFPWEP